MAEDQHLQQLTADGIGILSASERRPPRELSRKPADSEGLLAEEEEEHAMKVDHARNSEDAVGTPEAPTLCVVRMDRHIPDKEAVRVLRQGEEDGETSGSTFCDLFDVTLTDGKLLRKCLLHPSLNELVYAGRLVPGLVVRVEHWCHWYDETAIGEESIIILNQLVCTLQTAKIDTETLSFVDGASSRERSESPLIGERGYYLHVSNETTVYGYNWGRLENEASHHHDDVEQNAETETKGSKRWQGRISVSDEELELLVGMPFDEFKSGRWYSDNQATTISEEQEQVSRGNLYTISEILEEHEMAGGRQRSGAGPFLGRVVQKSKIIHYAKVSDSSAKYPIRAEIVVRAATVVLWTNMCAYYYPHLEIGDLVLVGKYRIKPQYPHPHGPPWELALNAGTAYLFKLQENQWPRTMPRISYDIMTSTQLRTIDDGASFDYIGRIIFVGRQERARKTPEWSGSIGSEGVEGGFRHYRWLLLQDVDSIDANASGETNQTSMETMRSRGLLVKLFTNSQDFDSHFSKLSTGQVVLLTDLKVIVLKDDLAESGGQPIVLSRSGLHTQVYLLSGSGHEDIEASVQQALSSYPLAIWHRTTKEEVAKALRWNAITSKFYETLETSSQAVSKQFSMLPISTVFLRPFPLRFYQATHPHVMVHTLRDVANVVSSLHHLERASVLVQGLILRVRSYYPRKQLLPGPEDEEAAPLSRKRKAGSDSTLLIDLSSRSKVAAPLPSAVHERRGEHRRSDSEGSSELSYGLPGFSASSLPAYLDGLLPVVSLSIDIENLNRNALCENVILVVPMDMAISSCVSRRRGTSQPKDAGGAEEDREDEEAEKEQARPDKRPKLDETTMLEEEEAAKDGSEADGEEDGEEEGEGGEEDGEEGEEEENEPNEETGSEEADKGGEEQEKDEEEAAEVTRPWEDEEKEEIALLSLARYLSLQSCLTVDEDDELHHMLAPYLDVAAEDGTSQTNESSAASGCSSAGSSLLHTQQLSVTDDSFRSSASSSSSASRWPTVGGLRQWMMKVLGGRRLVFLLELYAGRGPQRTVERVATALFPPDRVAGKEDEPRHDHHE